MNKPEKIFTVSDTLRYAVYQDQEFWPMADILGDNFAVYAMDYPGRMGRLQADPFDENTELYEMLNFRGGIEYREPDEEAARKHLSRRGYSCEFAELRGYSQGEWLDICLYWKTGEGDTYWQSVLETLRNWFRGDVYIVALEQLETYRSASGKTIERWEMVDTVGQTIFTETWPMDQNSCEELLGTPEQLLGNGRAA